MKTDALKDGYLTPRTHHVVFFADPHAPDQSLLDEIRASGWLPKPVSTIAEFERELAAVSLDVVVIEDRVSSASAANTGQSWKGLSTQVAQRIACAGQTSQVVVLSDSVAASAFRGEDGASMCGRDIALGIFERPRTLATLHSILHTACERARLLSENRRTRHQLATQFLCERLGEAPIVLDLLSNVREAASNNRHVLIYGEPGTGKNHVARAIHEASQRARDSFFRFDCRLLSDSVLESQLLGRQSDRSANAQAASTVIGPSGNAGTVVLDQFEHMGLPLQRRIRRLLRRQHVAQQPRDCERTRLIATSLMSPQQLEGSSRVDRQLLKCLAAITLHTPPLRQHPADIARLSERLLTRWSFNEGRPAKRLTPDAIAALEHHTWPGNLRELRTVLEHANTLESDAWITPEALRPWFDDPESSQRRTHGGLSLKDMERKLIESTFRRCGGNRERTARSLQIGVRTLSGKLREYGYPPRGGPGSNQRAA